MVSGHLLPYGVWPLVTTWCLATCYILVSGHLLHYGVRPLVTTLCLATYYNMMSGHLLYYGVWPLVTLWCLASCYNMVYVKRLCLAMCLLPTLMRAITWPRPLSTLTHDFSLGVQGWSSGL